MALEANAIQNRFEEGYTEMSGYFRHFGLKRDPFSVEEKESSLYLLPNWEQQIDLILHYIRHENALLALTGPKGVGKTTLVNFFLLEAIHGFSPTETAVQSDLISGEFLVQLGDAVRTCQVIADSALNAEQIFEVMAGAFDLPVEDFLGSAEGQSDILLEKLQHCKQSCVLLIDEAQELPQATLDLLLYMISQQSENQHRLHVVLIGEPDLKKHLAKASKLKEYQELIYALELEPLNLSQTEYYLKHRFSAAGLEDEIPFSNGLVNKIYKLSGGVPKMINQLARQSLLDMLKKKKFSSLGAIFKPYKKTFIGGGFLLASFAIILLYLGQDIKLKPQSSSKSSHQATQQKKSVLPARAPVVISLPPSSPPQPVVGSQPIIQPDQQQVIVKDTPPMPATPAPAVPESLPKEVQKEVQPVTAPSAPVIQQSLPSQPQAENVVQSSPQPAALPKTPETSPPEPVKSIVGSSSLIEPDSAVAPTTETQVPLLLPSQRSLVTVHKKKEEVKKIEQASVKKNMSKTDAVKTKPIAAEDSYTKHLTKVSPSHYTLKLAEVSSKAASRAFIAKHKLGSNVSYYRVRTEGDDKYVLVYGEYANAETAERAISLLSQSLQQLEPMPYKMSAVQTDIHHTRADE